MRMLIALTIVAAAGAASAQGRPDLGVNLSVYQPTSSSVQNLFGKNWIGIGPSFSPLPTSRGGSRPGLDFGILTGSKSVAGERNRVTIYNVGFQTRFMSQAERWSNAPKPYLGAGIGYAYIDLDENSGNFNTTKGGMSTSVFGGITLSDGLNIEARYRWFPKVGGRDLSGAQLLIGLRF